MYKYVCLVDFVKGIITKMYFGGGHGDILFIIFWNNYATNANYKCMPYEQKISSLTHQILESSHKSSGQTSLIQFFCIAKINQFIHYLRVHELKGRKKTQIYWMTVNNTLWQGIHLDLKNCRVLR